MADDTCAVEVCDRPSLPRSELCKSHQAYRLRTGNWPTHILVPPGLPLSERFNLKVHRSPGCWLWQAKLNADGYGVFSISPELSVLAHRFAYEVAVGPIPDGLVTDHLCRNRRCVNPDHLEPVTSRENTIRGHIARGVNRKVS